MFLPEHLAQAFHPARNILGKPSEVIRPGEALQATEVLVFRKTVKIRESIERR